MGRPAHASAAGRGRARPPAAGSRHGPKIERLKWTAEDFDERDRRPDADRQVRRRMGVGDLDAGFKKADLVLDETFVTQSTGHQPLETRTAMAYWQNGKLYMHGSTQSTVQTSRRSRAGSASTADQVVVISEYTGGGFGSKIPARSSTAIPALLSKKANAPVMMRITREEEHFIGRARPASWRGSRSASARTAASPRSTCSSICDNGPYDAQGDCRHRRRPSLAGLSAGAMRFRGLTVSPTRRRVSQRAPGGMQANGIMEPIIAKAAREARHRSGRRCAGSTRRPARRRSARRSRTASELRHQRVRQGSARQGRELFKWEERKAPQRQAQGTKVRGIGVAVSAVLRRIDRLRRAARHQAGRPHLRPVGHRQSRHPLGHRRAPRRGRNARRAVGAVRRHLGQHLKNLPWTCVSAGSQTTHAMTRAAHAAAKDAMQKLQEIAAQALGGTPASYKVADGPCLGRRRRA